MKSRLDRVWSVVFFCCAASALAGAPDWKLERTYTALNIEPFQIRFKIWFDEDRQKACRVYLEDGQNVAELPKNKFYCSDGLGKAPVVTPIPAPQQPLAESIKKRLLEIFPKAHNIALSFDGDYRSVFVNELTLTPAFGGQLGKDPLAFCTDIEARVDRAGAYTFQDPGNLTNRSFGGNGCYQFFKPSRGARCYKNEATCLVDYSLPPEIESASLIAGHADPSAPAIYAQEWDRYVTAIRATVEAMDKGSYQNPLAKVLERQGESALPAQFTQSLDFDFEADNSLVSSCSSADTHCVYEHQIARVPVAKTWGQDVPVQVAFKQLPLTLSGTINLASKAGHFTLRDAQGQEESIDYTLVYDENQIVRDGTAFALPGFVVATGHGFPHPSGYTGEFCFVHLNGKPCLKIPNVVQSPVVR